MTIGFTTIGDKDSFIKVLNLIEINESRHLRSFEVNEDHFKNGSKPNYKQLLGTPYDVNSLLHYSGDYLSSNGQATILDSDGNAFAANTGKG